MKELRSADESTSNETCLDSVECFEEDDSEEKMKTTLRFVGRQLGKIDSVSPFSQPRSTWLQGLLTLVCVLLIATTTTTTMQFLSLHGESCCFYC